MGVFSFVLGLSVVLICMIVREGVIGIWVLWFDFIVIWGFGNFIISFGYWVYRGWFFF